MDKIYSRKRIIIPNLKKTENKKTRKLLKVLAIMLIAVFTAYIAINAIYPVFEDLCVKEASNTAMELINKDFSLTLAKYNYQDIVSIVKTDNTSILKTDVVTINKMANEITGNAVNSLQELEKKELEIPIRHVNRK